MTATYRPSNLLWPITMALLAGACSREPTVATPPAGAPGQSKQGQDQQAPQDPQAPKASMLDTLLERRQPDEGVFVADCKDERYSESPALRTLSLELERREFEFKQPLYRQHTYYLNRLIPLLREKGKVWLIYDPERSEITKVLKEGVLDTQTVVWEQRFAEGMLCLVANRFEEPPDSTYSMVPVGAPGSSTTNVVFTPGGEFMLASTKEGRIRWFATDDPRRTGTAVLLPQTKKGAAGLFSGGESGLVGMTLHPAAAQNNRAFLHYNWQYADGTRQAIVSEWRMEVSDAGVSLLDERHLLRIDQPNDTHNAGMLVFGPDGYLYIAVGDGHDGTVRERSPATGLRGKVLRIDVDRKDDGLEYAIPADNPWVGKAGLRAETWAWGFRNPWRLSFLPDGRLIAGDIGEDVNEELTFVVKGKHHGWPFVEGAHRRYDVKELQADITRRGLDPDGQPPLLPYGRSTGMSVVAGQVYQGDALPELRGKFIFGDYLSGYIWSLDVPQDLGTTLSIEDATVVLQWPLMMPTVTVGPDRELYFGAHNGQVMKLVRRQQGVAAATPDEPATKADPSTARGMFGSDYAGPAGPVATDAQRALGRRLFAEVSLSASGNQSCASCHALDDYGQDSVANVADAKGRSRNVPSVFNVDRQFAQFRDYRVATVEQAVTASLVDHLGNPTADDVAQRIAQVADYRQAFAAAFPDGDVTAERIAVAIGSFLRALRTESRWERFLDGDDAALSDAELVGLNEFMMAGCTTCHLYRGLGGAMPQKLGLLKPWTGGDKGHGAVDPSSGQDFFFKVPALFNVAETGPYYHDGSMATLADAVRSMADIQLNRQLSDTQVRAIVTFLDSLTGTVPAALEK